jgi:hypothetical protein
MKEKFFSLSIVFSLFGLVTVAQTTGGSTTFGLRGGINFQNLSGKDANDEKLENKIITTWHAGVTADLPIAPDYFVQPGLLFSRKGADWRNDGGKVGKSVISYLEVPVNLLYKPVLADGRLLLGFGPYAAIGLSGKFRPASSQMDDVKLEFDNSATLTGSFTTVRRFDAGANFLAGYELGNNISFQLNAQLGMLKINPEIEGVSNNKTSVKNTGFGISVGYKL